MNKRKQFTKAAKRKALRALDILAVALANKKHTWSKIERRAYEQAVRVLT